MATVNITNQYLNKDKREHESVSVTLPAMLQTNGGRTNPNPVYVQYADAHVAGVVPAQVITGKAYLVIEEVFPAGTTITVAGPGGTLFSAVAGTALGVTVSSVVDQLALTAGNITITVGHVSATGNVTTGKCKVVLDYIPYNVKNGRYAANPV